MDLFQAIIESFQPLKDLQNYTQCTDRESDAFTSKESKDKFYWSKSWRKLSKKILERDHHECVLCMLSGRVTTQQLVVHHIQPLECVPSRRLDKDNLMTVCIQCHNRIHSSNECKWDDEWW